MLLSFRPMKFRIIETPRNGGITGRPHGRPKDGRGVNPCPTGVGGRQHRRLDNKEEKMGPAMAQCETNTVVTWLDGLANWETFFTGTVAPNWYRRKDGTRDMSFITCRSLQKGFEHFMKQSFKGVSYVVAYEPHKYAGFHCHALLSDAYGMRYKNGTMFTKWLERFGRNRTEGIEHPANVRSYVSKYITKEWDEREPVFPAKVKPLNHQEEIWWDVKIKGQREFANVTS